MMSDLPGDMIKQSFFAPAHTIRSIRYSLTARGLSSSPSILLPTGSSSLEKASGWILDPAPAAGIIPHMPPPSPAVRIPLSFRTRLPSHSRYALRGLSREPPPQYCASRFHSLRAHPRLLRGFGL